MGPLRVLGVHGVGNYQPGSAPADAALRLSGWWRAAVVKALPPAAEWHVDVAYYADRLTDDAAQGDGDPDDLDPGARQDLVRWARQLGAPEDVAQGRVTAPVRALVGWIASTYGLDHRLTRLFVTTFFREVNTYFTEPERRAAAREVVAGAIRRTRPDIVIAHSLGSAVAYEALTSPGLPDVDLLITLGSPLAMPDVVLDRLTTPPGGHGRPASVTRWINVADPGDIVAVPRGGVSANFANVAADLTDSIHGFDFHRVTSYLRCGATIGALAAQV